MRFSIIVPVYNGEKYLRTCVESVQKQSVFDWQLILIDDGSTDRSWTIMRKMSEQDHRIHCIHQENCGPFMARKRGIDVAEGDYLLFLDCDDSWKEHCLERLSSVIETQQPEMICFTAERDNRSVAWMGEGERWLDKTHFCKELMSSHRYNALWCKAFRRDLFDGDENDYGGFCGLCWGEDKAMFLHPVNKAEKIYYLPDTLYHYHRNFHGISKISSPKQIDAMISEALFALLEKYRAYWNLEENILRQYQLENLLNAYWRSLRACHSREEWKLFYDYPWEKHFVPLLQYGKTLKRKDKLKLLIAKILHRRERV